MDPFKKLRAIFATREDARQKIITQRLLKDAADYLEAIEDGRSLRPLRIDITHCSQEPHYRTIRQLPSTKQPQKIQCVAPAEDLTFGLWYWVILELEKQKFVVGEPQEHRCGCVTFEVLPRRLPG